MTHQEAHKILDMRREGADLPQDVVTEALALTDDLSMVEPPSPSLEMYVAKLRARSAVINTILTIDLGTRTGWAAVSHNHIVHGWVDLKPKRFEGGGMKYLRFKQWLTEVKNSLGGDIHAIYFEEVRRHIGVDAAHTYGGLMATLTSWCEHHGIPYSGVPVGTIKKHATGSGAAKKDAMIAAMQAKGHPVTDDNEADALALLHWAIEENKQ